MTLLAVRHTTTYRYNRPVKFGEHRMMFRPRDSYDQKLLEAWLNVTPNPREMRWVHDVFGNCVTIADFGTSAAQELRFESNIWLDHYAVPQPEFEIEDYARTYPFSYAAEELSDLLPAMTPAVSRSRPGDPHVGAPLPAPGPADRHRHAADDAHLRLQGELHLRAPLRARHARARRDPAARRAAAAAISPSS